MINSAYKSIEMIVALEHNLIYNRVLLRFEIHILFLVLTGDIVE